MRLPRRSDPAHRRSNPSVRPVVVPKRGEKEGITVDRRALGIEYFTKALRTGERTALERLEDYLAEDVVYDTNSQPGVPPIGREEFKGRAAVRERLFGIWPATQGYGRLGWSDPEPDDGRLVVRTSGAVTVAFSFDDDENISLAYLDGGWGSGAAAPAPVSGAVEEIPLGIRGLVNNARMNQTPMVVTYVDDGGAPRSSFRGSVCALGPTEIGIWARNPEGGLPQAITTHPEISLVYADFHGGAMLNIGGRAQVSADPETRRKVFELSPEVEQLHDLERSGAAIVVDVTTLQGFVAGSGVSLSR
jgi:hypothetical protein